jgi:hypothetical protein
LEWSLEEEIELIREEMVSVAIKKGIMAEETIGFSRKLDRLINQYEEEKESSC